MSQSSRRGGSSQGTKGAPPSAPVPAEQDRMEDDLDEALKETFPASDPIAVDPDREEQKKGGA